MPQVIGAAHPATLLLERPARISIKSDANSVQGPDPMLDISRDVDSLSSFKRNTPAFLRRLKKSGRPVVLTINGKPALVVQDPASYQQLLERAQRDKELEITQQSIKEMEAGLGRPAEDMLAEMRQLLDRKRKRSR